MELALERKYYEKNVTLECTCEKYCIHKTSKKDHKCSAICDICSEKKFLRKSSTTLISQSSSIDE